VRYNVNTLPPGSSDENMWKRLVADRELPEGVGAPLWLEEGKKFFHSRVSLVFP